MRKSILFVIIAFIMVLSACATKEENHYQSILDTYIERWKNHDFSKMYDFIAEESKTEYPSDQFIDRYEKIYNDLQIEDVKIQYEEVDEEKLQNFLEEGMIIVPYTATMDSVAGEIKFEYEFILVREEIDEEEEHWSIVWDPGHIFPPLKDGGEIRLQHTEPKRGEILDRNLMPLAINDYIYEVGVVPEKLENNPEEQKRMIASLLNLSIEQIENKLNENWVKPNLFVPLKKVPETEEKTIEQLQNIEAIMIRETIGRIYPLGEAAAHLIGYIGPITKEELEEREDESYTATDYIGKRGLEQILERRLRGEKGVKIIATLEDGTETVLAEKPVKDGENVTLTIDVNIQEEVFNSYDGLAGTAAVIHPKTGETLALVSSPSFDPNDFLYDMTAEKLNTLENDPKQPIINRFTHTFAPGSVIKPIVAAVGLQNQTIDPEEGIEIKGLTWDNGEGWGDYQVRRVSKTDKPVDLKDAIVRSDNIYFAMKAVEMGREKFIEGLKLFGFHEDIPFPYPIRSSTISKSGELVGEVELANSSYGQAEIETSPLYLAVAYSTFINDGNMIQPILLSEEEKGQFWKENLIDKSATEILKEALRDVVAEGTGQVALTDELAISGKTGTAELKRSQDEEGHENGWFVGYPTEEQNLMIAMLIEHVEDKGTSTFVAEKVRDILLEYTDLID